MVSVQSWHTLEAEDILQSLESGHSGLSKMEAECRLARFGPNELQRKKKGSILNFVENFL